MTNSLSTYWRTLANGTCTTLADRLLLLLLIPFSLIYALIQRLRAELYRIGLLESKLLPRPVISIGNLTVGGTGKTPVTAQIARMLLAQGYRVAVLSRGYGGSLEGTCVVVSDGATIMLQPEQCGDEPFLLASTIPGLMVVIGSDRYAAGQMAMEQLSPDLFLMDDGFQHLCLKRDLNILLMDHDRPIGNGWVLPAGLLREPKSASQRADLVIFTRCPLPFPPAPAFISSPVCHARHELNDVRPLAGGKPLAFEALRGRKILAFAGIAEPQSFFDGLQHLGLNLVTVIGLPDHVVYDNAQLGEIADALRASGADYAITTEKDGVKLKHLPEEIAAKTLLARLDLTIDDPAPLNAFLRNLLQK